VKLKKKMLHCTFAFFFFVYEICMFRKSWWKRELGIIGHKYHMTHLSCRFHVLR